MSTSPPSPMQRPESWDAIASGYAQEIVHHFKSFSEEALRMAPVGPSHRVLDLAAGPGTLAFLAAPHAAHVEAVDFSPGMVSEVQARAAREGVTNVTARAMDAAVLAYPEASFDHVFCMFAFMFFPDRAKVFAEIRRVLRPGGSLVLATWAPIERRPALKIGFDALAEALPELPPPQKGDLQDLESCILEVTEAGFDSVTAKTFTGWLPVQSPEGYVQMLERSGAPLAALKKKLGEAAWSAAKQRLLESVRKRLPPEPTKLAAEGILTCARR